MKRKLLLLQALLGLCLLLLGPGRVLGQGTSTLRGTVTGADGSPVIGATVLVKGTTNAAPTNTSGQYELRVAPGAYQIVISFVGFVTQTLPVTMGEGSTTLNATLAEDSQSIGEVVVLGYGGAQKQDQTGAVAVLSPREFNKGVFTSPDQLVQGRVSGVQLTSVSGQPGGGATFRIRGNSALTGSGQPLFVIDGVPIDGRTARPGQSGTTLGDSPDSNPLNFLNPDDIESIAVLKDASATAIYGARAAYGVVQITTKRGKVGPNTIDFSVAGGFATLMRRLPVLNASQFRQALTNYGASSAFDQGGDVDALGAILRTAPLQNYNAAISGGTDNGRYRLSLGYFDQQGIIRKTGFNKFTANFNASYTFLESKRLGIDLNINTSQFREQLAPISSNAGFQGSLIGQALQWNPTSPLRLGPNDTLNVLRGSTTINPLAMSEYYNDNSRVTTVLANAAPYYKVTDWLTARVLVAANYSTGLRRTSFDQRLNLQNVEGLGFASYNTAELLTQQLAATVTAIKNLTPDLNLNALVGYEYTKFDYGTFSASAFGAAGRGFGTSGVDYTDILQASSTSARTLVTNTDPATALQSVFGRAVLNYKDRYQVTGTIRSDQSTRFGSENRSGVFPSFALAWDLGRESFWTLKPVNMFKFRFGFGLTGNQEYPSGSSQGQVSYLIAGNGATGVITNANPRLQWQSDRQYNAGVDLAFLENRFLITADYFHKTTSRLLFPLVSGQPAAPGGAVTWTNLPGEITNQGVEILATANVAQNPEGFGLTLIGNVTFLQNTVRNLPAPIQTGFLNGQGLSGVLAQTIQNGSPINSFYTRQFLGIDPATGQASYADNGSFFIVGNPNPRALAGLSATASYRKLTLAANFNGVFGNQIYNNTLNSVLNVGQINTGRNIALSNFEASVRESITNPVTASSRFLESGSFVKLANLSLAYAFGDVGSSVKNLRVFLTGQNLFVITRYTGFDPEVNTNKANTNGVPSIGIDYIGYPPARTFTLGLAASL